MTSVSDSRCCSFPPHGMAEYGVSFVCNDTGGVKKRKSRYRNCKWFPLCVCVGGAIMGIKELNPRRKYEKEIAKWPPFLCVSTRPDHMGHRME